jgi:hypothetical protein
MEADWEFEIGDGAPVIDARWDGLVDLRADPALSRTLPEAADFPALAACLARLNAPASPVWTSKCDLWLALEPADFDADELDAPPGSSTHGMACYIDLLPRAADAWSDPAQAEAASRSLRNDLSQAPLRCCRTDLVIRRAIVGPDSGRGSDQHHLGITAYITACGPTPSAAKAALAAALAAFAAALCPAQTLQ